MMSLEEVGRKLVSCKSEGIHVCLQTYNQARHNKHMLLPTSLSTRYLDSEFKSTH